ncbi:expressed unknown protein [Seminavis robusta]|uniref:Uncharacterized protein n=1 Tax=Seminavis robusta TaxID=568900 RepID=A0A9N8DMT6_9STRA|nr:expressed unknown protein [Seminavis robusta]|eukprot:Sro165_g073830.1 n/a (279) ;mRNA; r:38028-38983
MKDDSNTSHTNNADHGPDSASMATPNSETSISGTARQGTQQRQGEATGPSTSTRTRATTIGGLKGSAEEADANGATRSCSGVTTTEASAAPNTCTATQPGLKLSEEGKAAEQTASANPGVATTNNDSALMVLTDMEARPSNTQQSGLLSFFPKEKQGENKGNLDKSTEKQAAANSKIPANDHNQNDQATINSAYIALSAVMPAAQVENRQSSAQLSFLPKKSSKPSGSLAPMMTGPAAKSRLEEADQTMPTINPSTNVTCCRIWCPTPYTLTTQPSSH